MKFVVRTLARWSVSYELKLALRTNYLLWIIRNTTACLHGGRSRSPWGMSIMTLSPSIRHGIASAWPSITTADPLIGRGPLKVDLRRQLVFALGHQVDRIGIPGAPGEGDAAILVGGDGAGGVNGLGVDGHPVADFFEPLDGGRGELAIGLGADVEQEIAALGDDVDQQVNELARRFVVVIRLVRPLLAPSSGNFPRRRAEACREPPARACGSSRASCPPCDRR